MSYMEKVHELASIWVDVILNKHSKRAENEFIKELELYGVDIEDVYSEMIGIRNEEGF